MNGLDVIKDKMNEQGDKRRAYAGNVEARVIEGRVCNSVEAQ